MAFALVGVGIGALEIGVILLVVLLIFGPSKLPQLGEGIGKMLRGFKKEMKAIDEDKKADEADKAKAEVAASTKVQDEGEIDVTPKGDVEESKKKKPA
jgi:sec-independent protein translocase protein TatA